MAATSGAVIETKIAELRAAGKIAQAVSLAQQALALAVDRDGRDSSAVANALITLAELYIEQGRKAEAEPLLRRALATLKATGADADQTAAVEQKLATLTNHITAPPPAAPRRSRRGFAQQRPAQPETQPQEPQRRAATDSETAWDVVPVFYGTDRAEEPREGRADYSAERGRRLDLGRALVTVPK